MNIEKIAVCVVMFFSSLGGPIQKQDVLMSDYVNLHTELIDIADIGEIDKSKTSILYSESEEAPSDEEEKVEEVKEVEEEENVYLQTSYASPNGLQVLIDGSEFDLRNMGCIDMYGLHYTYYSSNVLYHYRTPEWIACDDGLYRTTDGYIVVASSDYTQETIIDTPFGKGIVLDCGCASGTVDIYVNF